MKRRQKKGAKLIVTPEMGTTGYCFLNREEISSLVETIPGPTTKNFKQSQKNLIVILLLECPK